MIIHRNINIDSQKGQLMYLILCTPPNEAGMVEGKRGREQTNKRI